MTVYGLVATGGYLGMSGRNCKVSKRLFRSRAAAEGHQPEFLLRCHGDGRDLDDMDPDSPVVVQIVEHYLED
jgi:hypothetical protein